MDATIQFLQERWIGVVAGLVCVVAVLYFTRRYSMPAVFWGVEFAAYVAVLHVVVCGLVHVAAWFKYESQMKMLVSEKEQVPWDVPLKQFWDRTLYHPSWIFYLEIFLAVAIFAAMIWYKPMRVQRFRPKREKLVKGKAPVSAKLSQPQSRWGGGKKGR